MSEKEKNTSTELVPAAAVGIITPDMSDSDCERSLEELIRLIDTAGGKTVITLVQSRDRFDAKTCIGSGKLIELKELCENNGVSLVVFDVELSPSQIRNIEDALGGDISVLDRSMLILDIFAGRAVTSDGKLQVELAQLKYTAPRLMGKGKDLSRLGGGIGTRGPGESKLETDRRHLKRRVEALESALTDLERTRRTIRQARIRSGIPTAAIVGYTNAGKSTLLNRMTDAGILAEDKLFATLDPTTRKFTLPSGTDILLTDTVGFIRRLPHHLVKAFRSTLDEAVYADILLIVIDASDPEWRSEMEVTEGILHDLGAEDKPTLYIFNKCDSNPQFFIDPLPSLDGRRIICLSALTGQGLDDLAATIEEMLSEGLRTVTFVIPNGELSVINRIYKNATVNDIEYGDEAVTVNATADAALIGALSRYIKE
ncbi:MAG: GTPase HflX [Clostridia bacterium]|nr:GTPase HflX [Clostridia bacterium]